MKYKDYNDNELLMYICEGNEDANDILLKKYEPIISSLASKISRTSACVGVDYYDLKQEGFLALYSAINNFEDEANVCFYTFATKCIERRMFSLINRSNSQKNKILNESLSYDIEDDEQFKIEGWFSDNSNNPEYIITSDLYEKYLIEEFGKNLSVFEKKIFKLKIEGLSYKEISSIVDKESKVIDNTLQRIRKKIRKNLEEQL